jgi:hypothetical protein
MAFMVRASRPISSSLAGSGKRRSMVAPPIDSACSLIDSTGRSARPTSHQATSATTPTRPGSSTHRALLTALTLRATSSTGAKAVTVSLP